MHVSQWGCVLVNVGVRGGQKRFSDPLELELLVVVNCLTWVLGLELRSSAETVCLTADPFSLQMSSFNKELEIPSTISCS